MLINHILSKLLDGQAFTPTESQLKLIKNLASFITDDVEENTFIVKGYAGTGKTTVLSVLINGFANMGYKFVLLAPTGRAAKVISNMAHRPAYTIHKKIYRQKSAKDGFGHFDLNVNLHSRTIFIVDEASMISNKQAEVNIFGSGNLLNDFYKYLNNQKGCKAIFVGDVAQLPPVGLNLSPALNNSELAYYSGQVNEFTLTEVIRQKTESGILFNATLLREKLDSESLTGPLFQLEGFKDISVLPGSELIEALSDSYSKNGDEGTLVICRSNKLANKYNQGIRNAILWREDELSSGDLLMVVKNNYYWIESSGKTDFIANGDIIEIIRVNKYKELYGFRFAYCSIRINDYDEELDVILLLDALHSEAASLSGEQNKALYYSVLEDYAHVKSRKQQYKEVRKNEFFNALQVKYAYAVTCHKAQGGQWKDVFIDVGYLTKETINKDYLRWIYTAITRATENVYLVNFPKEFL